MDDAERIRDLLERLHDGDAWHGPSWRRLLDGVTWEQAAAHPIPDALSIWELVVHATAWHEITQRRLAGEDVPPSYEASFPVPPPPSEEAWIATVRALRTAVAATRASAAQAADRFDDPIADIEGVETCGTNLHGLGHHDAWHGGQIALLRRVLGIPLA